MLIGLRIIRTLSKPVSAQSFGILIQKLLYSCFLVSWTGENNYLVPSVHLVVRCLRPLLQCKAEGTLITPTRHSVSLWPFFISRGWKTRSFYCGF